MSKQSNQRYRKEKEKDSARKTGMESSSLAGTSSKQENKINREFTEPMGKAD